MWIRWNKSRAKSLDRTMRSSTSLSSHHSADTANANGGAFLDEFEDRQGALSRATSALFRRPGTRVRIVQDATATLSTVNPSPLEQASHDDHTEAKPDGESERNFNRRLEEGTALSGRPKPVTDQEGSGNATLRARHEAGIRARRDAIRAQQRMFGESHPDVLFALDHLAQVLYNQGDHHEAYRVVDERNRLLRRNQGISEASDDKSSIPRHILIIQE